MQQYVINVLNSAVFYSVFIKIALTNFVTLCILFRVIKWNENPNKDNMPVGS